MKKYYHLPRNTEKGVEAKRKDSKHSIATTSRTAGTGNEGKGERISSAASRNGRGKATVDAKAANHDVLDHDVADHDVVANNDVAVKNADPTAGDGGHTATSNSSNSGDGGDRRDDEDDAALDGEDDHYDEEEDGGGSGGEAGDFDKNSTTSIYEGGGGIPGNNSTVAVPRRMLRQSSAPFIYIATNERDKAILTRLEKEGFKLSKDIEHLTSPQFFKPVKPHGGGNSPHPKNLTHHKWPFGKASPSKTPRSLTSFDIFIVEIMLMCRAEYYFAWGVSSVHKFVSSCRRKASKERKVVTVFDGKLWHGEDR
jgi:hypothetical protein